MAPNPEFLNKVSETFKDVSETIVVVSRYKVMSRSLEIQLAVHALFLTLILNAVQPTFR